MSETEQGDDKKRFSHWKSLAELLGTPLPPEAIVQSADSPESDMEAKRDSHQDVAKDGGQDSDLATPPVEDARGTTKPLKEKRTPPVRPPSDWLGLAGQLGVPVPEPPPAPADEPEADVAPVSERDPRLEDQPEAKPGERATSDSVFTAGEVIALTDSDENESLELRQDEVDAKQPDEELEPQVTYELELVELDNIDFGDDVDREVSPPDEEDETSSEAEGKEEQAPVTEAPPRRRRRRGRRRNSSPERRGVSESSEETGEQPAEGESIELADGSMEGDTEIETDEHVSETRGRRSRRRRSSRRDEQPAAKADDRVPPSVDADDDMDSDIDVDDEEPGSQKLGTAQRAKHRKIPTWEEAISVIVSNNLESRSRNGGSKSKSRGSRRRRG